VSATDAVADLAPRGTLRAAINLGNPVLAARDPASGELRGVSVDLARELGAGLGVPVELVAYEAAGNVVDAVRAGAWDVAFLAIDPKRAAEIAYTPPYVEIEGAYLVREDSPIRESADVDVPGVRVVVATGAAYDLFLSRELRHATIVRAPKPAEVIGTFLAGEGDVSAGVRQKLEADAKRHPGLRLLPGRFMVIRQAMAMPRGRDAGARRLAEFVEAMKSSGFVARALARHGVEGATVAPPEEPSA